MSQNRVLNDAFLSWRDRIVRVVSKIVPPHEIEDIVQETYVRICQQVSKTEIRSPGAFMTRVARNLALDHVKRAETRLTCQFNEYTENLEELSNRTHDPFHRVASGEEFSIMCEAVRRLPLQCRRVFVLKKVYGHSQQEIASILNLSENTVEKHIAQGIKRCTLYMRRNDESEKKLSCLTERQSTNRGSVG